MQTRKLLLVATQVALASVTVAQTTIFVAKGAAPGGDGSSWATAYDDLVGALAVSSSGDQVWVAEGIYVPGSARTDTFQLVDGVELYGGFAGNESELSQRDPASHVTVLSGDVLADDAFPIGTGDNVHHVLTAGATVGSGALVDGFEIRSGNADATALEPVGAGLFVAGAASPTVRGCTFRQNQALLYGGAAYYEFSATSIALTGCTFAENVAGDSGGALFLARDAFTLDGCRFDDNLSGDSGGAATLGGLGFSIRDTWCEGNSSTAGGALEVFGQGSLKGCTFVVNSAGRGGAITTTLSDLLIERSIFLQNQATDGEGGGALSLTLSSLTLRSSRLLGNSALAGPGGAVQARFANLNLVGSELSGNSAFTDGGGVQGDGSVLVAASTLASNVALGGPGGALDGGATVVGSVLWDNVGTGSLQDAQLGGGAQVSYSCIEGWTGALGGPGNTGSDPGFNDAPGLDLVPGTLDDDLRLFAGSPCIDAGNNAADTELLAGLQPLPALDLSGLPRFFDDPATPDTGVGPPPVVDMGAYEFEDCNANGMPDYVDIALGVSFDCDGDGIPDDCVEPTGACCFFDLTCTQVTAVECLLAGGAFQGCGVPCSDQTCGSECPPAPPDPGTTVAEALEPICISNQTPIAWQAPQVVWSRDTFPRNKIDDSIDEDLIGTFDVVVGFRDCVTSNDVAMLAAFAPSGQVQRIGRLVTYVTVEDLDYSQLQTLAQDPRVALIERQSGFSPTATPVLDDVSMAGMRVTPSMEYSPETVEELMPVFAQGAQGAGINIAIVDSGVDNAHASFLGVTLVGGYDATTQTFGDPPDGARHGTLVASIALGREVDFPNFPLGPAYVARGVAPAANLIDVKIFDNNDMLPDISCRVPEPDDWPINWCTVIDGLETLLEQHLLWMQGDPEGWRVDVINLSLRQCDNTADGGCTVGSDGTGTFSQLVNLATSMGIVVVAAMGNDGCTDSNRDCAGLFDPNCFGYEGGPSGPGAASQAITVAGAVDHNTIDRADDEAVDYSTPGPRLSDGDLDSIDELKPDVMAPAHDILVALPGSGIYPQVGVGTSMAAPHVAGLAALILNAKPGISPGAVKDLIVSTAEPRGAVSAPSIDPIWNRQAGWGLVDAYKALEAASVTDLSYPNHPASPGWASIDITTSSLPPKVGQLTVVTAMVENRGANDALGVHVLFGVHVFSPTNGVFFQDIGTTIVDLPAGSVTPVSIDWIPVDASHQCMKVEIAYGLDSDPTNNTTQRNLSVASSPVRFWVMNHVSTDPITIGFDISCPVGDPSGWQILCNPPTVTLGPNDCPVMVEVTALPPLQAPVGAAVTVDVAAVVLGGPLADELLGGVRFLAAKDDCNGNGIDDFVEIATGRIADCNGNGEPDSCDIRSGVALDVNHNGIPDSCEGARKLVPAVGPGLKGGLVPVTPINPP